jgi:hypothetical protein
MPSPLMIDRSGSYGLSRLADDMQRIGALGRVPVVVGPRGAAAQFASDAAA